VSDASLVTMGGAGIRPAFAYWNFEAWGCSLLAENRPTLILDPLHCGVARALERPALGGYPQ
jgi:hypothetical protein